METKKTAYEKKAKKKNLLSSITSDLETHHDVKNTAIETGKDVVVGVLGGGVVGSAIGRASLLIGVAVTAVGHYTKSRLASIFGIGMMAANGFQKSDSSVSGLEGNMIDDAKERVITFKDNFSQKLYLDKIPKIKKPEKETKDTKPASVTQLKSSAAAKLLPVGAKTTPAEEEKPVEGVKFFTYPYAHEIENAREQDLTALDRVEDFLHKSAAEHRKENGAEGFSEEVDGINDINPEERNY
jgi:hypothetical protein